MSLIVGTCQARSAYCRDVFGENGLVSGSVRIDRLSVGTCSPRSGNCLDLFGVVGIVSGKRLWRSGLCRYVFGEVILLSGDVGEVRLQSGRFRRGRFIVGTCSAMSG